MLLVYVYNYLTPWSMVLVKQIATHTVKQIPTFYGVRLLHATDTYREPDEFSERSHTLCYD